jgi:hypothetical protein
MPPTVRDTPPTPLLPLPDIQPRPAKAALRKAASNDAGQAIDRARQLRGWSLKEFAGAAQGGDRQLARWMAGTEHPQLDTLFAIVSFRQPLIQALAERAGVGVDVSTIVTIRKVA